MKTWVKLYTEIIRDPDIGTLTWAQRGVWDALLALAGEIDARDELDHETGELDTLGKTAWRLRCEAGEFTEAVAAFTERGMVEDRNGVLFLPHFCERQQRAPSSSHERVAERVQRHRANKSAARNEDVTTLQRGVTPTESEADAELDTESEADAAAPQQQPAEPAPSIYGRHVESDPDVAFLFQQVDRAGVMVNGRLGDEQWRAILDVTRDHGLIQEAFVDAAASSARQPSPKLLRAILERCVAEGCRPGQWAKSASGPPAKRETTYDRSMRVLKEALQDGNPGNDSQDFGIVDSQLAGPREHIRDHPALPPGAG